jgi:hypothetical protein
VTRVAFWRFDECIRREANATRVSERRLRLRLRLRPSREEFAARGKKTPLLDERSCLVCVPGHLTRKPIWHARDTGRRFVSTSGAWGGASPRSRGGRARRRTVIIASRSSSYSADAASSGTHGESASAHAPAATRARAAEKMSHCRLSRATAREGITSGWERSGRDGTGGRSARARSGIERVDQAVARASRVSSPGAVAGRARAGTRTGPVQSLSLACE